MKERENHSDNDKIPRDLVEFNQLVSIHEGWVRGYFRSRVNDWTAADDLSQEVFLTAFRRIEQFRGDSSFEVWLQGIARNHLRNFIRKNRDMLIGSEELQDLIDQSQISQINPENNARMEALRDCLAEINDSARDLITERYFGEKSIQELSNKTGLGSSAVTMKLHRLRVSLAKCIERKLISVNS